MALFNTVKKYMVDNAYTHTDEWLRACLQWIQTNYDNVTDIVAKEQAYQQWVDADLQELGSCCLPSDLGAQKCTMLKGKYGVQMNSVQDIGESAYSQWKQLKKLENENVSVTAENVDNVWAPKPRRCLHLTLTDGKQTVYGLELTTIHSLSLTLKPGTKVLLTGPIECRRGILQLKSSNIKVLGGEVENLIAINSVDAMLCKRLDLAFDPRNYTQASSVPSSNNATQGTSTGTEFNDGFGDDDDQLFMAIDEDAIMKNAYK